MTTTKTTHHVKGYTIRTWPTKGAEEHDAGFEIFTVAGYMSVTDDVSGRLYGEIMGGLTDDLDKVKPTVHGHVKWDGCTNIDFGTSECMAHFCCFADVDEFCSAVRAAYRLAGISIPMRDEDLAALEGIR